ncbi:MAG: nuclear transport factor 2 family protein [Acidimicrobiales bacterium]|jgi:3-phenylpropionate/cinnamic acid dioxygenase small subunit|nr:nuclear transport factor 2 family protein [Acidimicrobiales bacterium]
MSDDRSEIETLLHRYAEAIDAGDFGAVGELFAHGRICGPDGTTIAHGADGVAALYTATTRRYPDDGTPKTRHMVTNVVVEVDGDTADVRSRFTVYQATDALPLQPIIAGDYADRFARVDGTWRFAERVMKPALYGDLSQHLLIEAHRAGDQG